MIRKMIVPLLFLAVMCSFASAETRIVEPEGVYAEIDTRSSMQAIKTLQAGTDKEKAEMAAAVESKAGDYCPAVFFSLAAYLFDTGKTDDALFWLYAGRIRTLYDIKRCTDGTAGAGYEALNMSVPESLKLMQFENMENTKKIVEKAIRWDKETPANYDPRWIALHGMGAYIGVADDNKKEPSLTIPEKEWKDLAEKNRKEYWDAFQEDIKSITPEQLGEIRARIKSLKQEAAAAKK